MPQEIKQVDWLEPWEPVGQFASDIEAELRREVPPQHVLHGLAATAIGRRIDCDDVLFRLDDGRFAVVHLTWSGKQDQYSEFPWTVIHSSIDDFIEKTMLPDARERGRFA